jgi:hypothetical protein
MSSPTPPVSRSACTPSVRFVNEKDSHPEGGSSLALCDEGNSNPLRCVVRGVRTY